MARAVVRVDADAAEREAETGQPDLSLALAERRHIALVLARVGGNRAQAARVLGIARATLYTKLRAAHTATVPPVGAIVGRSVRRARTQREG